MKIEKCKKVLLLLFVVVFAVFFCSCERYGMEIEDMMIIEGIGVDKEDGQFLVTVEMLNNKQSASADSSNIGEQMTLTYSGKGETVSSALRSIINKVGAVPNYTHNKIIVLSEAVVKKDISEILDFFERDYTNQPITIVTIAKGVKAKDILTASVGEDISKSETLEKVIEQSNINSIIPKTRIIDVINVILDETACIVLPAITLQKNGEKQDFSVESLAVFDYDNTFSYYVDKKTSEAITTLLGEPKNGTIVSEDENYKKATFIVVDGKTDIKANEENGSLVYSVNIKLYCDLNAYEGSNFKTIENETIEIFKRNIEKEVEEQTKTAFELIKTHGGNDCIRFGRRLLKSDKTGYENRKDNWKTHFMSSEINVSADVVIRRVGEESYYG